MTATLRAPARRTNAARPARTPARPRLRVIGAADRRARTRGHRIRLVVVGMVAVVGAAVYLQIELAQQQVRLRELTVRTRAAQAEYQRARLAHAEATAPARIIERATRLGLVPATTPRYVSVPGVLPPSGTSDVATSSTLGEGWEKVKPHLAARP
jgi:hypothetical protein